MTNGVERELKFVFTPETIPQVRRALERETGGSAKRRRLVSRYFDTDDDYLWRHEATLRLRDDGEHRVQTMKRGASSALDRDEYEFETRGRTPDTTAFERTPLARLLKKRRVRRGLNARIDVDVTRDVSTANLPGSKIETALDNGAIRSNGASLRFNELELELKEGESGALFELARRLCREAPISLNLISKAERGHLLAAGVWGKSSRASRPKIDSSMSSAEAFQSICRGCLHDFNLNMEALTGSDKVEAIHQGRIALRRLRAALQLFKPVVEDEDFRKFDEELRWISHVFGKVRDLDVFQEEAFEPAASDGSIPGSRELADLTNARRDRAHRKLNAAVASPRLRMLLVELMAWIEDGNWLRSDRATQKVGRFTRRTLRKRLRKFIRRSSDLLDLDPTGRHKVRIRAKKLRYMAGFFKTAPELVSGSKALRRVVENLEQIQDCLGRLHDQQARTEFLVSQVKGLPIGTNPLVPYAAGALSDRSENTSLLKKAWKSFKKLESNHL